MVKSMRYPPKGIRGVGTGLARAAQWNRFTDYFERADEEMCLLVQVESKTGLEQLDAIAAVEGVDGVFIGPSDLAASMGYTGQPMHPEVVDTICDALQRIRRNGKAAAVMALNKPLIEKYENNGANVVAVGLDTVLLAKATKEMADSFKKTT